MLYLVVISPTKLHPRGDYRWYFFVSLVYVGSDTIPDSHLVPWVLVTCSVEACEAGAAGWVLLTSDGSVIGVEQSECLGTKCSCKLLACLLVGGRYLLLRDKRCCWSMVYYKPALLVERNRRRKKTFGV